MAPKWFVKDFLSVKEIVCSSYINLLLVCIPLGFASGLLKWGAVLTFSLVSGLGPRGSRETLRVLSGSVS